MAFAYNGVVTMTGSSSLIPSTQTNFPVLLKLDSANCTVGGTNQMKTTGNGGAVQHTGSQASGPSVTMPFDLIFYSDSGHTTKIPWEVESYDGTTGSLLVWVLQASCSLSSNIYFGLGDSGILTAQNTGSFVPANVWDTNFKLVYHIGDGTTLKLVDSTSAAATITNNNATAGTGQVDGGGVFNGTNAGVVTAASLNLSGGTLQSISMWLKWTTFTNNDALLMETGSVFSSFDGGILIDPNESGSGKFQIATRQTAPSAAVSSAEFTRPSAGAFHHYEFVLDRTQVTAAAQFKIYVDGVSTAFTQLNATVLTGNFANQVVNFMCRNQASLFGAGTLDEVRISNSVRSANWITAEYNSMSAPQTFAVVVLTAATSTITSRRTFSGNLRGR